MWADSAAHGRAAPSSDDSKATQVNFVLHLGFNTSASDAAVQFGTVVAFARRYPSRVVVLCPMPDEAEGTEIRAKVYGECTLGKSKSDKRCCEFVMLSYTRKARPYLEDQVSICLSTDLPLYYWAHRFSSSQRLAEYNYLLTRSRRVLLDSSIAPADALTHPWPRPEAVRDLVYARLLPVRQSIGQFLNRYPTRLLVRGLDKVRVTHGDKLEAEGRVLLAWARDRLLQCGETKAEFTSVPAKKLGGSSLRLDFIYSKGGSFAWRADLKRGFALFEAGFNGGSTRLSAPVGLLPPENALAEAMFF